MEPFTQNLSITTFRYVPSDLTGERAGREAYLNQLNEALLTELQGGGVAFVSNAVVEEKYLLRSCIVNFRTTSQDVAEIPAIIARHGAQVHREWQQVKRTGAGRE